MRILCLCAVAVLLLAGSANAMETEASVGIGEGVVVPGPDENPCPGSTLLMNADGSYENGYAWRYGGVVPPYYGSFAEGYEGTGAVCGVSFMFTALSGTFNNQRMDAYVWGSDGLNPTAVLSVTTDVLISPPAIWPNISTHDIDIIDAMVAGGFFVGYWGNWPGLPSGWFVAADLNGLGGVPRTNIAPGIGYPSGWQDPSVVWGATQALGLGAYLTDAPNPTDNGTWGWIKGLFR